MIHATPRSTLQQQPRINGRIHLHDWELTVRDGHLLTATGPGALTVRPHPCRRDP